jgi:hypothetical protein
MSERIERTAEEIRAIADSVEKQNRARIEDYENKRARGWSPGKIAAVAHLKRELESLAPQLSAKLEAQALRGAKTLIEYLRYEGTDSISSITIDDLQPEFSRLESKCRQLGFSFSAAQPSISENSVVVGSKPNPYAAVGGHGGGLIYSRRFVASLRLDLGV